STEISRADAMMERVVEQFAEKKRKALLVQATGTGKTRVAISLCDAMVKANWAKRILFLCDRRELRRQANNAYNEFLPSLPRTYITRASAGNTVDRIFLSTYPAMMKVYTLATSSDREDRFVRLTTNLPERAAPNLALGALLTWDESTRTDFSRDTPSEPTQPQKTTLSIAQRLKKKIEIDFSQTPLHEAFAYIAEETGVRIEIDGAGLMGSGYTKNMEQNSKIGMVPANRALHDIIKQYEDMVLLVDEQKQVMTVTTKAVAEEKNLIPYDPMP
ncbi:MAG: DEAD/DEAH box helicase family protein, partial [Planctomycetes bacterium]|nr:DEAD/DEAH box helicase family protein [Planctomycetota bacterium]